MPTAEVTDAIMARLDSLVTATVFQQVESEIRSSLKQLQAQAEEQQESMTMKLRRVNTELTKQINLRTSEKDRLRDHEAIEARLNELKSSEERQDKQLQGIEVLLETHTRQIEDSIHRSELDKFYRDLE